MTDPLVIRHYLWVSVAGLGDFHSEGSAHMHAIVGVSKLGPEAKPEMAQGILANLRSAPGFVSGTFAQSPDGKNGRSMILFETEEAAKTAAANAQANLPADAPVEIVSIEVYEVVAHA